MDRFSRTPAGVKNHHAYPGGLLEHVVNLMEVAVRIADRYPKVDFELVVMGAFLHDIGKIEELNCDRGFSYTDCGQMLGHVVLALGMLDQKLRQATELSGEEFPEELALRLRHMIVSHHGQYEFGSPKLPMTLEAMTLHCLDNLDAKIHHFQQLIRDDTNGRQPLDAVSSEPESQALQGHARKRAAAGVVTRRLPGETKQELWNICWNHDRQRRWSAYARRSRT